MKEYLLVTLTTDRNLSGQPSVGGSRSRGMHLQASETAPRPSRKAAERRNFMIYSITIGRLSRISH